MRIGARPGHGAVTAPGEGGEAGAGSGRGRGVPAGGRWLVFLVLIGALTWLRIFTTWFAQDDFLWLLRASGGGPIAWSAPRVLSMALYFRGWLALFGFAPWAYHALSLLLQLASALLLYRVLARSVPGAAALAAAALVLTAPALFDALHWISCVADLLCATLLALTVWLVVEGGGRWGRWLSVVSYALALASKELAVGALPVLMVLHARRGRGSAPVARLAPAILSAALAIACARVASGAWQTTGGGAYAWKPAAILHNLPAFAAAALMGGAAYAQPSDLDWARLPWVEATGWVILAVWLAALVARRSAGAWLGGAWFLGLLAPVVMLEHQFQLYYVCCALPGFAASLAFLASGLASKTRRRIGLAAALLVAVQMMAIEARSGARLKLAPLPADFVLRRSLIAHNAIGDLRRSPAPVGSRLVMLGQQPVDAAWQGRSTTEATDYTRDPWWDENVRGALSDGDAMRLMVPGVREVVFKSWLEAEDTASTIAGYRIDGHLSVADYRTFVGAPTIPASATLEQRMARAGDLIRRRLFREALGELLIAREQAPDNPDILINVGSLQVHLGDSTAALATFGHALEVAPGDMDARYNLGLLQWRLGRRAEARVTWAKLLAEAPESDLARGVVELMAGQAR